MKPFLVYAHLIAACIAIGILFVQDLALSKLRGRPMTLDAIAELKKGANTVVGSLIVLWATGIAIVVLGYSLDPAYILNQKLWVKVVVVCILTLNGVFLHYYTFPRLTSSKGFLGNSTNEQFLVILTAVISVVSWLYSCYLGIARHWNNTAPFTYVMTIYAAVLGVAFIGAMLYWYNLRREDAYAVKGLTR